MKNSVKSKFILLCLILLMPSTVLAQPSGQPGVWNITEEDGNPDTFPWSLKFPNTTLTDNGDGTVSLDTTTSDHITSVALLLNQTTPQTVTASPIWNWGTSTRVPFYSGTKTLTDDADLTFDGTTLTAGGFTTAGIGSFTTAKADTITSTSGTAPNFSAGLTGTSITGTSFIIGANTLDTTEWAYLDGQDQEVKTTSTPQFANIGINNPPDPSYGVAVVGNGTSLRGYAYANNVCPAGVIYGSYSYMLGGSGLTSYPTGYHSIVGTAADATTQIARSFYSYVMTYTGAADKGYGFNYELNCASTGGDQYGVLVDADYNTPTLDNFYGVYVKGGLLNVNTAKWGIYIEDMDSYFGGAVTTTGTVNGGTVNFDSAVNYNTKLGFEAGNVSTGIRNTAISLQALYKNSTGQDNTAVGFQALYNSTTGSGNTAVGYYALRNTSTSSAKNTAVGYYAGSGSGIKSNNSLFGYQTGNLLETGSSNIFIGYQAGSRQSTNSNLLIIDNQDRTTAALEATNALIYGVFNATPASQTLALNANVSTPYKFSSTTTAVTIANAATTFAIVSNAVTVTGDAGGNTVATITGGISGQTLILIFVDALVVITDTNAHTANTVDLSAAFTSADDTTLTLIYDGTSWYETSRSVN